MTSKKKRQRGSRTHGGGTHKNRRGAGHRGGRGRAGRDKHEYHHYEPLGKYGFTRPEAVQDEVLTIDVHEIDEDVAVLVAEGTAEETDDGYRVDARDLLEDGYDADAVKVLGGGQVRNELAVVADAFSAGAVERLEEAGGSAELSERAEAAASAADSEEPTDASEDTTDASEE
jgi:large subunit ribosomal protein L15